MKLASAVTPSFVLLALVLQLGLGPRSDTLVLCVARDGHTAIESAACQQGCSAERTHGSLAGGNEFRPSGCADTLLSCLGLQVAQRSPAQDVGITAAAHHAAAAAPATWWPLVAASTSTREAALIRSIVLRI